ncbi:AMP-binding protein [Alteribacillus persepolensis]|uniref:AMP-binding protein n=1 Tax=Alteribacillus persepolensis TaxID=568899 RepID=UPI000B85D298
MEKNNEEVGEVIVNAPGKTTSDINKEDKSKKVFYKGWIYIGDIAAWNENEFITIAGRKGDMIHSSGENIHPV